MHKKFTTKAYLFIIDDQIFKVNADLLREALQITPKDSDHSFVAPPPENEIISFINKLGYSENLTHISGMRVNNMHQPWRTFMTMINKCLTGKATAYDRPRLPMLQVLWGMVIGENVDFAELIWEDFKFQIDSRKTRAKYTIFGMPIPMVMLNDDIKAFDAYMEYLTKAKGGKPAKGHGKGLVTKKGVELAVEKIATVRVPKKKRIETIIEQTDQSKGVEDDVHSEEIEEEEEPQLTRRRQTGVVIGCGVQHEIDEEALEHSKKLKGVERMSKTIEFLLQLKKASKQDFILQQPPKGSVVPDEPSGSSSSSSSKYEIKDISSDDESDGADDKEKADDSMTIGDEKVVEEQADEEHVGDEQHVDDQGGNEQARNIQA
ncbi:hypothetical protein Tco_0993654 [Tanacetum coccineum]